MSREPMSDRSSVHLPGDGSIVIRTPDCGPIVLTPDRALELCGQRVRDQLRLAVLDCHGEITLKAKPEPPAENNGHD